MGGGLILPIRPIRLSVLKCRDFPLTGSPMKPKDRITEPSAAYAQVKSPAKVSSPPDTAQQAAFNEALEDLAELRDYAAELGLPPPDPAAKKAAQAFLHTAMQSVPRCVAVSPWEKGAVAIYAQDPSGLRVDVLFRPEGGASCYATHPEKGEEEHHYSQAGRVENEWVFGILRELSG